MTLTGLLALALGLILTENLVLSRFLGLPSLLGGARRPMANFGLGLIVVYAMTLSCVLASLLFTLSLDRVGFSYLRVPVCAASAAAPLCLAWVLLRRYMPPLFAAVRAYLPLPGCACAVLGVTLLSTGEGNGLLVSALYGFFSGLGYVLVLLLLQCLQERLVFSACPKSFQGAPIYLLTLGILALAFTGFTGLDIW